MRSRACVLGHCIRHCLGRCLSGQFGRFLCRSLHSAVPLQFPSFDVPGLPDQETGYSKRRAVRQAATGRTTRLDDGMIALYVDLQQQQPYFVNGCIDEKGNNVYGTKGTIWRFFDIYCAEDQSLEYHFAV